MKNTDVSTTKHGMNKARADYIMSYLNTELSSSLISSGYKTYTEITSDFSALNPEKNYWDTYVALYFMDIISPLISHEVSYINTNIKRADEIITDFIRRANNKLYETDIHKAYQKSKREVQISYYNNHIDMRYKIAEGVEISVMLFSKVDNRWSTFLADLCDFLTENEHFLNTEALTDLIITIAQPYTAHPVNYNFNEKTITVEFEIYPILKNFEILVDNYNIADFKLQKYGNSNAYLINSNITKAYVFTID